MRHNPRHAVRLQPKSTTAALRAADCSSTKNPTPWTLAANVTCRQHTLGLGATKLTVFHVVTDLPTCRLRKSSLLICRSSGLGFSSETAWSRLDVRTCVTLRLDNLTKHGTLAFDNKQQQLKRRRAETRIDRRPRPRPRDRGCCGMTALYNRLPFVCSRLPAQENVLSHFFPIECLVLSRLPLLHLQGST